SFTYSASTPRSRRFTDSMNAGGQDHSRPTSRPTFRGVLTNAPRPFVTTDPAYGCGRGGGCRASVIPSVTALATVRSPGWTFQPRYLTASLATGAFSPRT